MAAVRQDPGWAPGLPIGLWARLRGEHLSDEFEALAGNAVEAPNRGATLAGCLHNTGQGVAFLSIIATGGQLVFQIRTAYFRVSRRDGAVRTVPAEGSRGGGAGPGAGGQAQLGRQPGLGGLLPAAKCVARGRGDPRRPVGVDCVSPARHAEFHDADSLLDWVELLAAETALPVGIKSAVGDIGFWHGPRRSHGGHRAGRRLPQRRRRRGRH
jgi:glutamate synthase domain-containing protein 2